MVMSKIKALQEAPQCPLYQGMQMERVEKNDQKSQTMAEFIGTNYPTPNLHKETICSSETIYSS